MDKKRKKESFYDDGRVIADMSVEGMPGPMFRRKSGQKPKSERQEPLATVNRRERFSAFMGVVSGYLLFGLIVFGGFALFILFCIKVWFK